jgi:5-methylcytosine-specific restriction endonuclease McrA
VSRNYASKKCQMCGEEFKPTTGRVKWCPPCRPKAYASFPCRQPEVMREYHKKYYEDNRHRAAQYRIDNRGKSAAYRARNAERIKAYNDAYHVENKIRERLANQERRARKNASAGKIFKVSPRDGRKLFYSGKCYYCSVETAPEEIWLEHVIPLSRGGDHSIGNLVPTCMQCNISKHDRTPMEWKMRLRRQIAALSRMGGQ